MPRTVLFSIILGLTFAPYSEAAGERILPDFEWTDLEGKSHRLSEPAGSKITVFAFSGIGCPMVNLYAPKLERLHQGYSPKGVRFFWINSNALDTREEMAGEVKKFGISFPAVKDEGGRIADILGAERTTDVFVVDSQRALRYQGRIDTQYGIGYHREEATENFLTDALDALLAGDPVKVVRTDPQGCIIARDLDLKDPSSVTYAKHISRILQRNCISCHRPGEVAPFSLLDYTSAKRRAEMLAEVINDRRMPPWHADESHGVFANKRALSRTEVELVNKWVENGAPEGDPKDLPDAPEFTEGWAIGTPDMILEMPVECRVPAEGLMDYQYFGVKTELPEDKWVKAIEVRPGNPSVVHHVLVFILYPKDRKGEQPDFKNGLNGFFASMVPGDAPAVYTDGCAKLLPKGATLIFQMHYTPNGTAAKDRSRIGLVFADGPVKKEVHTRGIANTKLRIPPHAPDHVEFAHEKFERDAYLLAMLPHMHLRGKSFKYTAFYPDGSSEILLSVPKWDFGWQNAYRLAEPKRIPKGTRIECEAHWDNSAANPANPDPNAEVRFDEQTNDEMLIGYYDFYWADEDRTRVSEASSERSVPGEPEVARVK
ncbi:MAG: hypothetical protein GHCLOJNM_04125 [bacterium]|nr:hypothetical protein [bacterium]